MCSPANQGASRFKPGCHCSEGCRIRAQPGRKTCEETLELIGPGDHGTTRPPFKQKRTLWASACFKAIWRTLSARGCLRKDMKIIHKMSKNRPSKSRFYRNEATCLSIMFCIRFTLFFIRLYDFIYQVSLRKNRKIKITNPVFLYRPWPPQALQGE